MFRLHIQQLAVTNAFNTYMFSTLPTLNTNAVDACKQNSIAYETKGGSHLWFSHLPTKTWMAFMNIISALIYTTRNATSNLECFMK